MSDTRSYGRGARILSAGIATTGLVTFAYFSLASHALEDEDYGGITLLWAALFLIISIIYRPVEQLLSRTISIRRARGEPAGSSLRTAVTIQVAFAAMFLIVALALRETIRDEVFAGSSSLYWVLVGAVLAYAASYFARGWLAGHGKFGLYGGLVLLEACSRCLFALAAVIGIATGQSIVALGIVAAPLVSLVVVPWALNRRETPPPPTSGATGGSELSLREGGTFAGAVVAIMAAEQALLNVPVLVVWAVGTTAMAGYAFTVLLITRAPLQLFQAIQTTLLPHLSGLAATQGEDGFRHALRVTLLAIAAFTAAVVLGLAAIGPWAMDLLFPSARPYDRLALVLVGFGMGFHLAAGTLNQAALARGRAAAAAAAWTGCALLFVIWLVASPLEPVLAVAAGYCATTALLALALWRIEATAAVALPRATADPVTGGVSVEPS